MHFRYAMFLACSSWLSAFLAVAYHLRFLLFVEFASVRSRSAGDIAFYFVTGLGHESFAVFFVVAGIGTSVLLRAGPQNLALGATARMHLLARLYIVIALSLILGAALDCGGVHYLNHSGLYFDFPDLTIVTLDWHTFAANLFLLQPFLAPTFGSNRMLYLLSYLLWHIVAACIVDIALRRYPRHRLLAGLTTTFAVVIMLSQHVLLWLSIWMVGLAVAACGQRSRVRPPMWISAAMFGGALILSRHIGSNPAALPPAIGSTLLIWKYLVVAAGFGMVALALYPAPTAGRNPLMFARVQSIVASDGAYLLFFHFPVVMLLVGLAADLYGQALRQEPDDQVYAVFAVILTLSLIITIACGRIIQAVAGLRAPLPSNTAHIGPRK